MSPRYIRNRPRPEEETAAALLSGLAALGFGLVVYYCARLFLARDEASAVLSDSDAPS